MSRPRHLKIAALAALWVLSTVALVAWFQRPGQVLTVSGPDAVVMARDGELVWTLNLPLDAEDREDWLLPTVTPLGSGVCSWRDERTCVFTPTGVLPPSAEIEIVFPPKLRAAGGFRYDAEAPPRFRARTLPALTISELQAAAPAFGPTRIDVLPSRMPADPAVLSVALSVSPSVPMAKTLVDGRLRLTGQFAPGTTYRVTVTDTVAGSADDRPLAWQGEIVIPARTPGARLAAGVGREVRIEAVNMPLVVVENAAGQRDIVRFTAAAGDAPARAELPAWLLAAGENHLWLRWDGGESEVTLTRHAVPLTPADGGAALLGGALPVVSTR